MLSIAATGHRPQRLGGFSHAVYERLFDLAYSTLVALRPNVVISGMALGWDTAVAEAAVTLCIPLHAYIPFVGQESQWPKNSQEFYHSLIRNAARVVECSPPGYSASKMHVRDRRMVDDCDRLLALWDGGSSGGTYRTIQYAESKGKKVTNMWEDWEDDSCD